MAKVNGLDIVRIPINGKNTLRVMRNGKELWNWTGLPSGYTLLEYIQSTGSQYIDTEYIVNSNSVIHFSFSGLTLPRTGDHAIFGSGWGTFHLLYNSVTVVKWWSGSNAQMAVNTNSINKVIAANKYITVNGTTSNVSGLSSFPSKNFCILNTGDNANGSGSWRGAMKIHACQIYDNGTLIRDFVPCKNSSGESGLFDKVNKVFYKSLSSTQFVAGPVAEYTQLKYIQSNGNQYIDTGFKPSSNTRIVIDMEPTSSSTGFLFGSRVNSSANAQSKSFSFVNISGTSLRSDFGSVENTINISPLQRLTIDKNKNVTTVNGQTVTASSQSFSSSYNLYLLTVNTAGVVGAYVAAKIYSCKIYDNGSLVRDYIPALRSDGTYGLYDKVNKVFYNSASGTPFTGA